MHMSSFQYNRYLTCTTFSFLFQVITMREAEVLPEKQQNYVSIFDLPANIFQQRCLALTPDVFHQTILLIMILRRCSVDRKISGRLNFSTKTASNRAATKKKTAAAFGPRNSPEIYRCYL
ncbi:uncharacterized protein LOC142357128 [Convolutriloba macropyga]|uniref:uncharacterized protein LOC142357128 n=1 Tax=Convolutriloba macropyga TaxID=536237 RepID=UPI003F51C37B